MAMMMTAANVARGMILRGLRVSSPKMAVASKPMKHRKAKAHAQPYAARHAAVEQHVDGEHVKRIGAGAVGKEHGQVHDCQNGHFAHQAHHEELRAALDAEVRERQDDGRQNERDDPPRNGYAKLLLDDGRGERAAGRHQIHRQQVVSGHGNEPGTRAELLAQAHGDVGVERARIGDVGGHGREAHAEQQQQGTDDKKVERCRRTVAQHEDERRVGCGRTQGRGSRDDQEHQRDAADGAMLELVALARSVLSHNGNLLLLLPLLASKEIPNVELRRSRPAPRRRGPSHIPKRELPPMQQAIRDFSCEKSVYHFHQAIDRDFKSSKHTSGKGHTPADERLHPPLAPPGILWMGTAAPCRRASARGINRTRTIHVRRFERTRHAMRSGASSAFDTRLLGFPANGRFSLS